MSTFWLVALVVYLLVGAVIARLASVRLHRDNLRRHGGSVRRAECDTRLQLFLLALGWPAALLVLPVLGIRSFIYAPVARRQRHAEELRADAKYWDGVAREEIDGEKKAMAEELARSLREQAKGFWSW